MVTQGPGAVKRELSRQLCKHSVRKIVTIVQWVHVSRTYWQHLKSHSLTLLNLLDFHLIPAHFFERNSLIKWIFPFCEEMSTVQWGHAIAQSLLLRPVILLAFLTL